MKHILHIHNENRFTWIQLSDHGDILSTQEIDHLATLGAINHKEEWLILIPGHQVLLTSATLPKTRKRELQKAIPFALEEQLITDVDKLYFACGQYDENNCLVIGVIDKKILENYSRLLNSYKITPSVLLPDFLAIPYVENRWSIVITDEAALVRTGKQTGFATFHHHIRLLLQLTLEKHKNNLPEKICVYNLSQYRQKNITVTTHQVPIENISSKNPYTYLQTLQSPPLNLLQNHYRANATSTSQKRWWLYAGVTAVAWAFIWLSSQLFIWADLKIQSHHLQTQITKNYLQIFPNATDTSDARSRTEHELNALIHNSQGGQFIYLLSQSAQVLQHYPDIQVQSLNYQQNLLILQITTNNWSYLSQLVHGLNQQGLTVKQNQTNNRDKHLTAELIIQ